MCGPALVMLVYVPTQGEGTGAYNEEGHERLETCTQNFKLYTLRYSLS